MSNEKEVRQLEDVIMNKFISDELPLLEVEGLSGEAKYETLPADKKEAYDLAMFKYFQNAQMSKAESNDRYSTMEFPNFVKLHNPNPGFHEVLRDKDSEPGAANVWHDVYNRDTALMKESALKGLRRMIAAQG